MAYQDFREFLDVLRRHGELIDIDRPVALSDVGKALKRSNMRQGPALHSLLNGGGHQARDVGAVDLLERAVAVAGEMPVIAGPLTEPRVGDLVEGRPGAGDPFRRCCAGLSRQAREVGH